MEFSKKKSYDSYEMDEMLQYVKNDEVINERVKSIVLNRYSLKDATAIMYCISQGFAEAFNRFNSSIREEFITVFEDVYFSNATI